MSRLFSLAVSRQLSLPRLLDLWRMLHILTPAMVKQLSRDLDARIQTAVQHSDIDPEYCSMALHRPDSESGPLLARAAIEYRIAADLRAPVNVPPVTDKLSRSYNRSRRTRRGLDEG